MNRIMLIVSFAAFFIATEGVKAQGMLDRLKQKAKDKVNQRVDDKTDRAMDKTLDDAENKTKGNGDNSEKTRSVRSNTSASSGGAGIKAYQNYDFVPGEKILFEDNFTDDKDGELPSRWKLEKGQGQLNKIAGEEALFITEGNYAIIKPRMKTENYLTDPFTVEFDYLNKDHAYPLRMFLKISGKVDEVSEVAVGEAEVSYLIDADQTTKHYPEGSEQDNFINKWHHVAIAVKNRQLKVYVDQNRVLVVPDTKATFSSIAFGGTGSEENPLIFKDVKIASGGGMNMIGKKFTESKIITHGITFDVNKYDIKPESMGTLNMIAQILKENPDVKFEIGGHTDNSGDHEYNRTLSKQRADAVRTQLVSMGIDGSRLTTKGYGDTKPITSNNTQDEKATNRRVEFVKIS